MDQLDRKTKLLIVGGACLLLVIGLIVLVVSCSTSRQEEPEPTPVVDVPVVVEPTPTVTPSIIELPEATPTQTPAQDEVAAPTLPGTSAAPSTTEKENSESSTRKDDAAAVTTPTLPNSSTNGSNQGTGTSVSTSGNASLQPASTSNAKKPDTTTPVFDFGLPTAASVGTQVVVNPSSINVSQVSWSVSKSGFLGVQTNGNYTGTLNANGGSISFAEAGKYTLTATAASSTGKSVTVSQDIEILPVGKFGFGLPKTAYTDTVVDVEVLDGVTDTVTWRVQKDGQEMALADAFSGTLSDTGGFITFRDAGTYKLTGTTGGGKSYHADITVYPVLEIPLTVPASTYRNTEALVEVGEIDLQGQPLEWRVEQDGKEAEYTGTLTDTGGPISFASLGAYQITASVADVHTGRVFSATEQIRVVNQRPNAPEGMATVTSERSNGKVLVEFAATATDPDGDDITLEWLYRGNDYFGVGVHTVRVRARDSMGDYSPWTPVAFEVLNTPPDIPVGVATIHRDDVKNRKAYVTFDASATDPDNDPVTYEWDARSGDDYYALGSHTVRVRAMDTFGAYSAWADVPFTITNEAPARPTIIRTPAEPFILPGNNVTITATTTDPDGDAVEYVWENRPSETYAYPEGRQIVKVYAVDAFGAQSPAKRIMFLMGDPNRAGNLMLTGPSSSLSEPGIEDATLIYYKFVVPPVAGHSGQDYGRVRGYNRLTGQWDQLDYGTTSNGISFERNLAAGVYTKLDLYYYTNHDCMYNKSNITYIALFEFDELEDE